jgi:hypothetical protein
MQRKDAEKLSYTKDKMNGDITGNILINFVIAPFSDRIYRIYRI